MTPQETQIAIVAAICTVCGLASFTQGVREGRNTKCLFDLTTEISGAVVAGATTYFFAKSQGLDIYFIYFLVLGAANNAAEIKAKVWEQVSNVFTLFKGGSGGKK
ncbi:TPA: hypothetical protein ACGQ50_000875 [Enterobacter cloacae]